MMFDPTLTGFDAGVRAVVKAGGHVPMEALMSEVSLKDPNFSKFEATSDSAHKAYAQALDQVLLEKQKEVRSEIGDEMFRLKQQETLAKMKRINPAQDMTVEDAVFLEDEYRLNIVHKIRVEIQPKIIRNVKRHLEIVEKGAVYVDEPEELTVKITRLNSTRSSPLPRRDHLSGLEAVAEAQQFQHAYKIQHQHAEMARAGVGSTAPTPSTSLKDFAPEHPTELAPIVPMLGQSRVEHPTSIFVGNPGAGKSTLLNSLAGKKLFKAGESLGGSGVTTVFDAQKVNGRTLIDTPGLSDITKRKLAAEQIQKALNMGGDFHLVFVSTTESGRIRPDDLMTMKTILEACQGQVKNDQYTVVINKCRSKWLNKMRAEPGNLLTFINNLNMFFEMSDVPTTNSIHFQPEDPDYDDDEDEVLRLQDEARSFFDTLPVVHITAGKVDELNIEDWQKRVEEAEDAIKRMVNDMLGTESLLRHLENKADKLLYSSGEHAVSLSNKITSLMMKNGKDEDKRPFRIIAHTASRADTFVRSDNFNSMQDWCDGFRATKGYQILNKNGEVLLTWGNTDRQRGCVVRHLDANGNYCQYRMYTDGHYMDQHDFGEDYSNCQPLLQSMTSALNWLPLNSALAGYDMASIVVWLTNAHVNRAPHRIVAWRGHSFNYGQVTGFVLYDSHGEEITRAGSHIGTSDAWLHDINVDGNITKEGGYLGTKEILAQWGMSADSAECAEDRVS